MPTDSDYVLGTHDEELARLGLQHRVWRPVVLDCWQRAGLTVAERVRHVGTGPGYATVDLAEIAGPTGEVVALERSRNFIRAMEAARRARSLTNVKIHEIDLMTDHLPTGDYDFAWCRWVVSFVVDPALLTRKLARVWPHVFCLQPRDYMWQWPATFIETYLPRLIEMGRIDEKFADQVRTDLASAEANPNGFMVTPLVLEIVAEKL